MVAERRGVTGEVRPPAADATAGREEEAAAGGATTEERVGGAAAGAAPTDTDKNREEGKFYINLPFHGVWYFTF